MADFGTGGTRTVTTSTDAVRVKLSDPQNVEHLHFFITAKGGTPIFNLSCKHRTHWSEQTFGPPAMNYERVWPFTPGEVDDRNDAEDDTYAVSFSFLHAVEYKLRIERHDAQHNVLEVVKDIDYASDVPSDKFREAFVAAAR